MKQSTGWVCAGVIAAAFAAAAAGLSASADAAANPYAGNYTGGISYGGGCQELCFKPYWTLSVTISASGKVTGVANYYENVFWGVYQSPAGDGSANGTISADGTLKLTAKEGKHSAKFSGDVTVDVDGDLLLTGVSGSSTTFLALTPQ